MRQLALELRLKPSSQPQGMVNNLSFIRVSIQIHSGNEVIDDFPFLNVCFLVDLRDLS